MAWRQPGYHVYAWGQATGQSSEVFGGRSGIYGGNGMQRHTASAGRLPEIPASQPCAARSLATPFACPAHAPFSAHPNHCLSAFSRWSSPFSPPCFVVCTPVLQISIPPLLSSSLPHPPTHLLTCSTSNPHPFFHTLSAPPPRRICASAAHAHA